MTLDPLTLASIAIVILAFLALAGVALFVLLRRKPSPPPPMPQVMQYDPRPYSLSRAIDDAKHEAADILIRNTLGNAHAVQMGKTLATMEGKPPGPNP